GKLLNKRAPMPQVTFDPNNGFRSSTEFGSVLDVLYFLVVAQLPTFRFCANCGALYLKDRLDKNTCSQRCASLLGKRRWARNHRHRRGRRGSTLDSHPG